MRKSKSTPWSYRKGSSPLHRLPAGLKLVFLLLFSFAAFFPGPEVQSLTVLGVIALVLVILSFIAGIGPRELLRGSGPLFLVVLAVFLLRGIEFSPGGYPGSPEPRRALPFVFNTQGLLESVIFCGRIGTAFAAGTLLFAVTTSGEIKKSLSRAETTLHLEKLRLGLSISLMLAFLPRFFEIWEELTLAWKSRSGKKNLSRLLTLIPLLVERMMVKAAETASAMGARGALL